jgi:hypothetical protein
MPVRKEPVLLILLGIFFSFCTCTNFVRIVDEDGGGGETAAPIIIDGFSRVRPMAAPVGICVLRQFRIAVVAAAGYT